jgi:hypothetical protein
VVSLLTVGVLPNEGEAVGKNEGRGVVGGAVVTAESGDIVGSGDKGASVVGAGLLGCGVTGALDGCDEVQMSSYSQTKVPKTALQHSWRLL